ncbi:MAG TPA: DUF3089 domain-containing protein [Sphingomicrobium sp.]|nr:DUF3089 domain-containing protein [Sphingomicrobium sp.]
MIPQFFSALAALLDPAPAKASPPPPAIDYSMHRSWLCLPTRKTICSTPLATTALNANGYGSTGLSTVAKDPPIDCFYVYPTVSRDQGMNSDMNAGPEEELMAAAQAARFSSVCRVFAPVYRQMTVASIAAAMAGGDVTKAAMLAYSDVSNAWRNYIATRNNGRPFVLIGHSQGSLMLQELIKREIEGKPVAKRMIRAIIPGFNVLVPEGKRVGGTFKSTPLCASQGETGCVMAWVSYRENRAPPEGAMFGFAPAPGMTVACTNPANPGSTGWEALDSYWYTRSSYPVAGGPIGWSTEGAPATPYVRTDGLVSAKCVNDGRRGYLALRTNHKTGDKRTDRIGGEVGIGGLFLPGWGMHLADMPIAQGDLIRQIGELSARSRTAPRPAR